MGQQCTAGRGYLNPWTAYLASAEKQAWWRAYLLIAQNNDTPVNLTAVDRRPAARNDQMRFDAAVLFLGGFPLALADGFGRADYGWAGRYGANDAEDHCCDGQGTLVGSEE